MIRSSNLRIGCFILILAFFMMNQVFLWICIKLQSIFTLIITIQDVFLIFSKLSQLLADCIVISIIVSYYMSIYFYFYCVTFVYSMIIAIVIVAISAVKLMIDDTIMLIKESFNGINYKTKIVKKVDYHQHVSILIILFQYTCCTNIKYMVE